MAGEILECSVNSAELGNYLDKYINIKKNPAIYHDTPFFMTLT